MIAEKKSNNTKFIKTIMITGHGDPSEGFFRGILQKSIRSRHRNGIGKGGYLL